MKNNYTKLHLSHILCKILIVVVSLSFAMDAQANLLTQKKVTLNKNNSSVVDVLLEIQKQTGLSFAYEKKQIEEIGNITINVQDITVEQALDKIFGKGGYVYTITQSNISIKKSVPITTTQKKNKIVNGKVIDKDTKKSIAGATILILNSTNGAITDNNGNFSLNVQVGDEIEVSFVGMVTLKKIIGENDTNFVIEIKKDEMNIEDVVVTGYQNIKRDRSIGNTETIMAKDLANSPHTSVDNLLAGKIAGLAAFSSSGRAGSNSDIRIRGVNTLSGTTQPLWVVDGLPLQGEVPTFQGSGVELQTNILNNGIGNIPPSDIASITVLKDAAATAIYGAKAANGVIVITTKRPAAGGFTVTYNASVAISQSPNIDLDFMNTTQKIKYETELFEEWGNDSRFSWERAGAAARIHIDMERGKYSTADGQRKLTELGSVNTNWMKEIFRNSFTHTHSLSMNGGTEKIQYYASVNYQNQAGILLSDKYDNFSGRINATYKPNKFFDIRVGLTNTIKSNNYHASNYDPFKYAVYANPYEKPYNEDGSYAWDDTYVMVAKKKGTEDKIVNGLNIINEIKNTSKESKYNSTGLTAEMNIWFAKGLRLSSKGIVTNTSTNTHNIAKKETMAAYTNNWVKNFLNRDPFSEEIQGYYNEGASFTNEYSFNNTLEYTIDINDWFINALVGQEIQQIKSNDMNIYMPEYLPEYDIVGYPNIKDIDPSKIKLTKFGNRGIGKRRYSSFFFTASAGYKEKYIINFNARYDGADIIGSDNRFTPLWSISTRWNIHKEAFMKSQSLFNELFIKGQFGYTGNINRSAYPFTVITLDGTDRYKEEIIAGSYTHPNPSIKWEEKKEIGASLEASMFDYRFNFNLSYYNNQVNGALSERRLPISAGVSSQIANISDVLNEGVEFSFNIVPVRTRDFLLGISGNLAYNKNKVDNAYYKGLDDISISQVLNGANPLINGYGVGSIFGVISTGVNPESGFDHVMVNRYIGGDGGDKSLLSNYEIQDVQRGKINAATDDDKPLYIGNLNPDMTGGFGINMTYKNWSLSGNFVYEMGHLIPKFSERLSSPGGSTPTMFARYNVTTNQANRWRNYGDVTDIERYQQYLIDQIPMSKDYEKGDYLKLRNVILSYNLPLVKMNNKFLQNIKMMRCSFQCDNLFTLTKYSGIDPELRTDFGYAIPRSYRFTLSVSF